MLPISSMGLNYAVSDERVSTGVPRLDVMMDGKGYYKGSSILISGMAGTGKSSLAAAFVNGLCRKGKRCMYFSFEESPEQIMRNMRSIGFDLGQWVKKGLLEFRSMRPQLHGLEMHLATMHKLIQGFAPAGVVVDPVTNLSSIGDTDEIKAMLTRVIDFLKAQGVTSVFTSLTAGGSAMEQSEVGISSLMDTWLLLRMVESANERNRILYVLKSRGMGHSNQMREFILSDEGIRLLDVYTGAGTVYTGSARLVQESKDAAQALADQQSAGRRKRELEQEAMSLEAQVRSLKARLDGMHDDLKAGAAQEKSRLHAAATERDAIAKARKAD